MVPRDYGISDSIKSSSALHHAAVVALGFAGDVRSSGR
jgi:hypothetical protein